MLIMPLCRTKIYTIAKNPNNNANDPVIIGARKSPFLITALFGFDASYNISILSPIFIDVEQKLPKTS